MNVRRNFIVIPAPGEAPRRFTASRDRASPTLVNLRWAAIPARHRNGVIRGYEVTAVPSQGETLEMNISSHLVMFQLTGLTRKTLYTISIAAFTEVGKGPTATIQILLLPGGSYRLVE